MDVFESLLDGLLLSLLHLEDAQLVVQRCHLQIDVVVHRLDGFGLFLVSLLLDFALLLRNFSHLESGPLVERDLLRQQPDQVLDLVGLLAQLLLFLADVCMLSSEQFVRLLSVLKQLLLGIHVLHESGFDLLEVVALRKRLDLGQVVVEAGLLP